MCGGAGCEEDRAAGVLREFVDTDSPRNRSFGDSTPPRAVPIAIVLDLIGFPGLIRDADLVITGEGSVDEQTLRGKAPAGVRDAARLRRCRWS